MNRAVFAVATMVLITGFAVPATAAQNGADRSPDSRQVRPNRFRISTVQAMISASARGESSPMMSMFH